jgi:multidrug resistance efflux pump
MGIRTPAMLMVLFCTALSTLLFYRRHSDFSGKAVTDGPVAVLMAQQAGVVQTALVAVGAQVEAGQPILVLSSSELMAARREVDARIRHAARSAEMARLTLLKDLKHDEREQAIALLSAQREAALTRAERTRRAQEALAMAALQEEAVKLHDAGLMDPYRAREQATLYTEKSSQSVESQTREAVESRHLSTLRKELGQLGADNDLVSASEQLYAAEVDVLMRERDALDARIESLTVRAPRDGHVAELVAQGSQVQPGVTLARIASRAAQDVVLYTSAQEGLPQLDDEVAYTITLADGRECRGHGRPRAGSEALLKPAQLTSFGGFDSMGFPLRVALPQGCSLPIGQVVDLRLTHR